MKTYSILQVEEAGGNVIEERRTLQADNLEDAYRVAAAILARDFGPQLFGFGQDDPTLAFGEEYGCPPNRTRVYEFEVAEGSDFPLCTKCDKPILGTWDIEGVGQKIHSRCVAHCDWCGGPMTDEDGYEDENVSIHKTCARMERAEMMRDAAREERGL